MGAYSSAPASIVRGPRLAIGGLVALLLAPVPVGAEAGEPQLRSRRDDRGIWQNAQPMVEDELSLIDWLDMLRRSAVGPEVRTPRDPQDVIRLSSGDFGPPSTTVSIRWFGHSTVMIEIEGRRVLTDPIWSDRASPVGFVGPKRFSPPLIPLADLPTPDAVVISHDHYDHLDEDTVRALAVRGVPFYVPLGVGAHLRDWGVDEAQIHEHDWWQESQVAGLRLVCAPARHFSGRSLTDRNRTLWASWAILGQRNRVYFGGDSGLFPGIAEIGERLGPFDVTMLDSGAYNPMWRDVHMGPEQALRAHRALGGKVFMPIHWALFNLSFHGWTEPGERVLAMAQRDGDPTALPRPGQIWSPAGPLPFARWWPSEDWRTESELPLRSSAISNAWWTRYAAPPLRTALRR